MKQTLSFLAVLLVFAGIAAGQSKTNDAITRQIKELKAEKTFTLNYDAAGNTSKIMFFSEDFGRGQYENLGLKSLSFGMAFFYPGKSLEAAPDFINLTFWVQTKKPKFADAHRVTISIGTENLDLGDARYTSKPNENMEYLNFRISREVLTKVVGGADKKLKIGNAEFKFTPEHLKSIANFVKLSDPAAL